MDILLLNKNFETVRIIDRYTSLVWTERYGKNGDFSMELRAEDFRLYGIRPGNLLWRKDMKSIMVIQYIRLKTDETDAAAIILKGESIECYLDRRVPGYTTTFDGTVVRVVIETLLKENFIESKDEVRKVDLTMAEFPADADTDTYTITLRGESVGEIIRSICETYGYGYELKHLADGKSFRFRLYKGTDRSWAQDDRSWRVFSPEFNNLLSSEFAYDDSEVATGFVICGEAESQTINPSTGQVYYWPQVWVVTDEKEATGWDRKEKFIDGSGISRWQGDYIFGTFDPKPQEDVTHGWKKLPENIYRSLLLQKTEEQRSKQEDVLKFEAVGDTNVQWHINEDVFLGDIVQVVNEYGVRARCRITAITWSHDVNGIKFYPTFETMEGDESIEWLPPKGVNTRSSVILCTTLNNI